MQTMLTAEVTEDEAAKGPQKGNVLKNQCEK